MPVASYTKFNNFIVNLGKAKTNLTSGSTCSIKAALTTSAPTATWSSYNDINNEVADGNGYTTGGKACAFSSWAAYSTTGGRLILDDPTTPWTGSGAGFTFRYVVLYDSYPASATDKMLIAYYDYGSSQLVSSGETFTLDLDGTNGVFTIGP